MGYGQREPRCECGGEGILRRLRWEIHYSRKLPDGSLALTGGGMMDGATRVDSIGAVVIGATHSNRFVVMDSMLGIRREDHVG